MPNFNEFRINELLLGKVLVARQNFDLAASEDEQIEVRQFLHELEEKKREESSTLFVRLINFFTGKKHIQITDRFGNKIIRELTSDEGLKPELRISFTVDRQIDFGDDVNAWRKYIHEENIRSEQRELEKKALEEDRERIVAAYAETINKKMMKII
jgi:hypothetical protein